MKHGATRYVLGDPGRRYSAYADRWADKLGVKDLPAGRCEVTWLDCLSGRSRLQKVTTIDALLRHPTTFCWEHENLLATENTEGTEKRE